mmetsp:Transcript_47815/g.42899  ORF Transcript_47815/g.42899 Transcript_47815/m.42899 type:complete len:90 (-) Transcript_47815:256-525(-)
MKSRVRQIGLESPVASFADILESSRKQSLQIQPIPDFRSDDTETPTNERATTDDKDNELQLEQVNIDDEEEEEVEDDEEGASDDDEDRE